jgi:hypothetical protein
VWAGTYTIGLADAVFDGDTDCGGACSSGDIIQVTSGNRYILTIKNVDCSGGAVCTVTNNGGQVNIDLGEGGDSNFAFYFFNNKNIKITGTGDGGVTYGFLIDGDCPRASQPCANYSAGIWWGDVTDIEMENVEVKDVSKIGINHIGTTAVYRAANLNIHDNYFHDIGSECVYLGRFQDPWNEVVHQQIENIIVANNRVVGCGFDGIQVRNVYGSASITENYVEDFAWQDSSVHRLGITTDQTCTSCDVTYNHVYDGLGPGIYLNSPIDGALVHGNVVIDVGKSSTSGSNEGIRNENDDTLTLTNNTVIMSGDFSAIRTDQSGGTFEDNIGILLDGTADVFHSQTGTTQTAITSNTFIHEGTGNCASYDGTPYACTSGQAGNDEEEFNALGIVSGSVFTVDPDPDPTTGQLPAGSGAIDAANGTATQLNAQISDLASSPFNLYTVANMNERGAWAYIAMTKPTITDPTANEANWDNSTPEPMDITYNADGTQYAADWKAVLLESDCSAGAAQGTQSLCDTTNKLSYAYPGLPDDTSMKACVRTYVDWDSGTDCDSNEATSWATQNFSTGAGAPTAYGITISEADLGVDGVGTPPYDHYGVHVSEADLGVDGVGTPPYDHYGIHGTE